MKRVLGLSIVILMLLVTVQVFGQDTTKTVECYGSDGSSISIMGVWSGQEEDTFKSVLEPVLTACNLTLNYEGTRDLNTVLATRVDGGDPPDISAMPNVGALTTFADNLVPLDQVGINADNYDQSWKDLGMVNGKWLGLPVKTDIKSLVWYSPVSFKAASFDVPATWDDFIALMDNMVANTKVAPLAMGFESGGATGWTATDFVQDMMIRLQGADFTNGMATGKTPWNDPGVVSVWEQYVSMVKKYADGGTAGAITTNFADAILKPFQDPPQAWMVKQSGFAGSANIQPNFPNYVYGEDFAFFVVPTVDGKPVAMQVGGDFMGVFNDTPAVKAVIAYLSSADGAKAWAASGFDLTPNSAVTTDAYTNPISADKAAALAAAPSVSFDVGDLLPAGLNQAEFDGITAVVGGADAKTTLDNIESQIEKAMGKSSGS